MYLGVEVRELFGTNAVKSFRIHKGLEVDICFSAGVERVIDPFGNRLVSEVIPKTTATEDPFEPYNELSATNGNMLLCILEAKSWRLK